MSTIPTTFNEALPSYTVIGGRECRGFTGLSVILLNRGGRYTRRCLFRDFEKAGFDTVVSVEPPSAHYDIEELSDRFPFVRFMMLQRAISPGEQINLAVSELDSPLLFVLWDDMKIFAGGTARRMAERLTRTMDDIGADSEKNQYKRLCTPPILQTSRFDTLPSQIVTEFYRNKIQTQSMYPGYEGLPSLYPYDGVGIYDRDRFIRLGGFDRTLKNFYWQLMDFGFRAHLWDEEISITQTLKLTYEASVPVEDYSPGMDYLRFYLKNIAPVFRNDGAILPLYRFPPYFFQTSGNIFSAWEDFAASRRWVHTNSSRWRGDSKTIVRRWNQGAGEEFNVNGQG
jgi:hypothetical protein